MTTTGAEGGGLIVERKGAALHLTLARPHAANALDGDLVHALAAALDGAIASGCAAVVLGGQGADFCLGMDIAAIGVSRVGGTTRAVHETFARILEQLAAAPVLTIALLRGRAMGGGLALAAACDVTVGLPDVQCALPEALNGLVPANAAPAVVRRAGHQAARRLALTTEPVDAGTALRLGLLDYVVADGVAAEGLVRRLSLRAARLEPGMIAEVKATFSQLAVNSAAYGQWAVARITQLVDDRG